MQNGLAVRVLVILAIALSSAWAATPHKPHAARSTAKTASRASSSRKGSTKSASHAAKGRLASARGTRGSKKGKKHAEAQPAFRPRYTVARPVGPLPVAPESMTRTTQTAPAPSRSIAPQATTAQNLVIPSAAKDPQLSETDQEPTTPAQEPGEGAAVPDAPTPAVDAATAASMLSAPGAQPFRNARQLDKFFAALAAQQASRSAGGTMPIVRAMQFGDSHTAADIYTGEVRAQLQSRFGNGGLGYQYPGHPFAGYKLAGSQRAQTSGWVTQGNRFTQLGDGDTGLGGIAISATRPGESVFVTTTCETLQVQYLRQPGGGALDFSDNGQPVAEIRTASDAATGESTDTSRSAGTFTYSCSPGVHEFQLITMDAAPVRLLGWVTEQAGITYECLGINGAVAPLILRWNPKLFADYMGARNPDLIVLAYGTNEASNSDQRNEEYVAQFRELIRRLHQVAPNASVLVLGPYDRALRVGRGRRASWQTSTAIDRVIADQREVCRTDGCAFYDQRSRMGGPGSMLRWASHAMAQADHTHLTGTGYRVLADALYGDLMTAYNSYLKALGTREN